MAVALPLGERVMELCDVAEERGLGEGASNEGVHRLGDTLEREHLRDEQVHDVGFDAGAVLAVRASGGGSMRASRRGSAGSALICASA